MAIEDKLDRANVENFMELTSLQQGMLFHYISDEDSTEYCEQLSLIITGDIKIELLQKAWDCVIENNEMLRTIYRWQSIEKPVQIVLKRHQVIIKYMDFTDKLDKHEAIEKIKLQDLKDRIDITRETLRIYLCKMDNFKHEMIISNHHIIYDGWSNGIILKELMENYSCLYKNEDIKKVNKTKFSQFIKYINGVNKEEEKEYWTRYLQNIENREDYFNCKETGIHKEISYKIDKIKENKIYAFAKENKILLSSILYSAWGILLQKLINSNDVLFGTTISGRPENIRAIDDMVGLFINTIPLRVNSKENVTFIELIRNLDKELSERKAFENTSLVNVKEYCGLKVNEEAFNSIVTIENYPIDANLNEKNILTIENFSIIEKTNYNMSVQILTFNEMEFKFNFNILSIDEEIVEKFGVYLERIIDSLLINPNIRIEDIELLSSEEKNQILYEFNNTKADYPKDKTIQVLFEEQVEKTPNNIAVVFEDKKLTYRELNEKANSLARSLRNKDVKTDTIVGIMVERSVEMIVGIMGILKSGGAYLPIDPSYPKERIEYILKDSRSNILLSQNTLVENIYFDGEIIDLFEDNLFDEKSSDLDKINCSNDLAYVIYTSGTTGNPKGVGINQSNIVNTIFWRREYYAFDEKDSVLQIPSFGFDSSVEDILTILISGGRLVVIDQERRLDVNYLRENILRNSVTNFLITPAFYNTLLDECLMGVKTLKKITIAGESVNKQIIEKHFRTFKDVKLLNEYGPTENSVCSTIYEFNSKNTKVLIGKPIFNTIVYILDKSNKVLPIGVAGEICISGDGLARGYLNRAELTAEKFTDNPFKIGTKMYKTGDLARWLPDGNIEFLGRIDNQVKIRGFRIELEEIENKLLQNKYIKEAVVVVKENNVNDKYICAYLICEKKVNDLELKNHLRESLPEYMIPTYFMKLERVPLTHNGKIDRRSLPDPNIDTDVNLYEAPRNRLEEKLAKIWCEVLGVEKVGINDNFFDLGGHSLKATVLISKIHKELNREIRLKELFKAPQISALSKLIETMEENPYSTIENIKEQEYYEVSSAQKRMYIVQQFDKDSIAYNMPAVFELKGEVDKLRIEEVFKKLSVRHEALRTYLKTIKEEIVQVVDASYEFKLLDRKDDEEIESIINNFVRPFELERAPLFRVELVENRKKTYLLIDMHHIISDGVSISVLINDFTALYKGEVLEPLKLQYKDFAAWQNNFLKSEEIKMQELYWVNMFNDEVPVLNLPYDYERPAMKSFEGDCVNFELDERITDGLRKLTKETGTTMHMVLLSTFNILLSKYSGQHDIVIGTPISGRPHAELQNIMGMFVNTLALRNKPKGDKKYIDFLKEVKENSLKAYENQSYQFESLVEKLDTRRDTSKNPLFDVMLNIEDTVKADNIKLDNLSLKQYNIRNTISKFELTLNALEKENTLEFRMDYCTKLFNKETIERMSNHYIKVLDNIINNIEIKISEIELLTEEERNQILYEFNDTKTDYYADKTIYELFEEQVENTPNNIAVVYEDKKLTYKELNEKSNSLARILRSKGINSDSIIGIMMERSIEMIIGIIAALKAGGAYLPIDPNYPKERIEYILNDSKCSILLTEKSLLEKIEFSKEAIDLVDNQLFQGEVSNLEKINNPNDLVYVIYTSGTTGNPKGTMVKHHSFTNLVQWYYSEFEISEKDNILLMASVSFDLAQKNIYAPLMVGGKLILANKGIINYEKINAIINENKITIINCAPSAFNPIIELNKDTNYVALKSLKYVFLGGETINLNLLNTWMNSDNFCAEIVNTYGPTECTDIAAFYRIKDSEIDFVPIGKPINNAKVYILNKDRKMLPVGVSGELYISGDGVSRGYNNKELTSEKFVENPFEIDTKMYKTGDLARWLPDGNVEFLGRIDNQIKIRGFRIELGEIENTLLKHEHIKQVVVLVREGKEKEKFICAYIVSEKDVRDLKLRNFLRKKVPEYMIPTYFVKLDKIPLTPNGKLDRRSLPEPNLDISLNEYEAPRNKIEEKLSKVWCEVLGVKKVGINDNFFELGGQSLKATILMSKIHKELNKEIPLKELFKSPTIKELSKFIENAEENLYSKIEKIEEKEYYDITSTQRRMYALNELGNIGTGYNMPVGMMVNGQLDIDKFTYAINSLIERHESLRTCFDMKNGEIIQRVKENVQCKINFIELEENNLDEFIDSFIKPFNMLKAPLLRVALIKININKYIIVFDMHHIISDGISMQILSKEFIDLYSGKILPKLYLQYKDFAQWQNNLSKMDIMKKQEAYWLRQFNKKTTLINLPIDYEKTMVNNIEGTVIEFEFDENIATRVEEFTQNANVSKYMMFLAIFNIMLFKYSGMEDIVVGTPVSGRNHSDLSNIIGIFVNTLPIRNYPLRDKTFEQFLNEVKSNVLLALENQDYQYEQLIDNLREIQKNDDLFNVMFALDNDDNSRVEVNGIEFVPYKIEAKTSKCDLTLGVVEGDGKLSFHIEYLNRLFKQETIQAMGEYFINITKEVLNNNKVILSEIIMISIEKENELFQKRRKSIKGNEQKRNSNINISKKIKIEFDI